MSIARIIFLLFSPACIAILLKQVIWGSELTHQLLGFGTFLFCIEQANMANQDLQKVSGLQKQIKDIRLIDFYRITIITIILELMGFYLSSIWLGWGFILILISLIFFNLFVEINIHTSTVNIIRDWKITERFPVLIADIIGLILASLWILKIGNFWISWGLFSMALIFCGIKLFLYFKSFNLRWEI